MAKGVPRFNIYALEVRSSDPNDYRSGKAGEFYGDLDKKAAAKVAARLRREGRKYVVTDLDMDPNQTSLFDVV
ncbi:hypothetical protein [Kineococcus sp. R86509]|uniref:hypothetical protein n=1 Tax=Kineococcus sp. R86509 TaxID=3093851 RepID=UPI0036D37517